MHIKIGKNLIKNTQNCWAREVKFHFWGSENGNFLLVAFSDSISSANFRKSEEFLKFGDQLNFSEATFINTTNNIRVNYGHFGVLPIVSKFLTPMTLRLGNGHWRKRDLLAITIGYQLSRCFEKSPIVANNWCTYHHWREPLIVVTFLPQYLVSTYCIPGCT